MKKIVLCVAALSILSSCTHEMPLGKAFKASKQLKLNSASHWNILAEHEANLIKKTLDTQFPTDIFIKDMSTPSPFSTTYRNLLTSHLTQKELVVKTHPGRNIATVHYLINVIEHPDARYQEEITLSKPLAEGIYYLAGTVLAEGLYDMTEVAIQAVKAPFYNVNNAISPNLASLSEVAITTQIIKDQQIINSDSRIYYVDRANLAHYKSNKARHFTLTDK